MNDCKFHQEMDTVGYCKNDFLTFKILKGIFKNENFCHNFTLPHAIQNLYDFVSSAEYKQDR